MSTALQRAWRQTLRQCGHDRAITTAVDGRTTTFRELDARAAAWRKAHLPAGEDMSGRAVVFAVPNGTVWLEIFIGLLQAGAVIAPLDAAEPPAAQRRLAESLRASHWWNGTALVELPRPRRFRDPETSLIKLTSGTTGSPRPLVFTGNQVLADARQVTATMGIRQRDLNYALIPLGHSYGLGNLTLPLIAHGVPMVCGSAALPHAMVDDFARWRPTVFPGVPAIWRALAGSDLRADALASLRLGISAGAPLPPEVAREFHVRFGRHLHNFYGSSETGGIAYDAQGSATLAGQVGKALRGVRLVVAHGQRLKVASAAVVTFGHSRRLRGWGVWTMPDRVAVDARGRLTLLGRRGGNVKIAGRRVGLADVEARLRRLPGVSDVWVGVSAGVDPMLGAVVATDRLSADLRAALQMDTPSWKIPKKLVVVPSLPLTVRGKTDVRALQARLFKVTPG